MKARILAVVVALILVCASIAGAQFLSIGYYHTTAAGGMENSAVVLSSARSGSNKFITATTLNYSATVLVAMVFDAASLPSNGAIPLAACALPAGGAAAPTSCTMGVPGNGAGAAGIILSAGLVMACSTTGKTLTVDTTSGGECTFQVGFAQ